LTVPATANAYDKGQMDKWTNGQMDKADKASKND
jgi:hypothetical protein